MLARANRLTVRADFTTTTRKGHRANTGTLTGFLLTQDLTQDHQAKPPQFGFQVSRRVGGSVERHRVVRQLRHLVAPWVAKTPAATTVVIRPDQRIADYKEDLDLLMQRLLERSSATHSRKAGVDQK